MASGSRHGETQHSATHLSASERYVAAQLKELERRRACCPDATCPLRARFSDTAPVPPQPAGPGRSRASRSPVALVGEGPGHFEMLKGRPFVGPSGEMLDWLLKAAGVPPRNAMHITNAAMCEPRAVEIYDQDDVPIQFTKQDTLTASVKACRGRLIAELAAVRPLVVLAVGGYALESLTGRTGVLKHHGATIDASALGWPCWVVPMLHPAALLRNAKNTDAVVTVLARAFRIAREGKPRMHGTLHTISPRNPGGPARAVEQLRALVDQVLADGGDISIDVETTHADARDALLTVFGFGSLAADFGCAVSVLAWNRGLGHYEPCWPAQYADAVDEQIARIVSSPLRKWYWNYRFDVTVLERYYPETRGPHADGMHLHWLMQPELEHGLAFAVQSMLDVPPWKHDYWREQDAGNADDDDLLVYNARDCLYTAQVIEPLQHAAAVRGNDHLVDHQMRVAELARRAEAYGVPIDQEMWQQLYDDYEIKQRVYLQGMRDAIAAADNGGTALTRSVQRQRVEDARRRSERTGKYNAPVPAMLTAADFAPRSPLQARWYLYEFCKLRAERFTAGGQEGLAKKSSVSYKGVLGYLRNPLVKLYIDFAEFDAKLVMLRSVKEHATVMPDGSWRVYVSWSTTGMKGTRWTSKVVNLQNWEKKLRKLLRARPGRKWVGADGSQIEYRIAAALAGIKPLLDLFNAPAYDEHAEKWKKYDGRYDAHSLVAEMVFGDEYKKGSLEDKEKWRTLVKRVVYAMFYGAHPEKIVSSLREDRRLPSALRATLSLTRIDKIWRTFKTMFPEWDAWAQREMDYAQHRGWQDFPPFGRRRWWRQRDIEENKIRNTPIQLAAGDVCNLIFCNIQDRCDSEGLDAQMTIHGHDAIYLDCDEQAAPRVAEIVDEEFHYQYPGPAGPVHIYGQASLGDTVADVG